MLVSATVVVLVVCFWTGTAWLQRSSTATVELPPAGPYRVISSAGPVDVAVVDVDRPLLRYDASWLLLGPEIDTGPEIDAGPEVELAASGVTSSSGRSGTVEITCPARLPCRAATTVELPPISEVGSGGAPAAADLTVGTVEGDVTVVGYAGDLVIVTAGTSSVYLGAVGGRASVSGVDGEVAGFGLTASDVDVEVVGGAVELRFATRPRSLKVRSDGGPVTIGLPDGNYAVSVTGGTSNGAAVINVGQAAGADSTIEVHARGPVRIEPNE
jgi:hypothetical protein